MKRLIALWLAALMLAAQPIQAAVCVGFGQTTGGPTLVLDDTLYEASSTALTSHTVSPGPGGPWSALTAGLLVGTEGVSQLGTSVLYAITDETIAEGSVVVTGKTVTASSTRSIGAVLLAVDGSAYDGYRALLTGLGSLSLKRMDDGTSTEIQTSVTCAGHDVNTEYEVKLTRSGVSPNQIITGEVVGQSCSLSATDNTYSSGSPGIALLNDTPRITGIKAYSE